MKLVELQCGTIRTWRHLLVRGASEKIRFEVPVKCFYIEHNTQRLLFDAGQKPLSYSRYMKSGKLRKICLSPRSVRVDQESVNALLQCQG